MVECVVVTGVLLVASFFSFFSPVVDICARCMFNDEIFSVTGSVQHNRVCRTLLFQSLALTNLTLSLLLYKCVALIDLLCFN